VPAARHAGIALGGGFLADLAFGDPGRRHPVAGFGQLAQRVEAAIYAPTRIRGIAFAGALVGSTAAAAELAARVADRALPHTGRAGVLGVVTFVTLGGRSLTRVAGRLADQLEAGDIAGARSTLPSLCGRDPQALDAAELCRAGVESVAENTSDAVVGALLWGALAGPAGAAAYRAANTLDAMVGHRTDRYRDFGWAAARLDDLVNWPAARLTSALTATCAPLVGGRASTAWATLRRDGPKHPSPNAGRVEAAFAGALGVRLGGPLTYAGSPAIRPLIGAGPTPDAADLRRASRLSLAVGAAAAAVCAVLRTTVARRAAQPRPARRPARPRTTHRPAQPRPTHRPAQPRTTHRPAQPRAASQPRKPAARPLEGAA
jgi:adenosylcobinamide-phosphate synthase